MGRQKSVPGRCRKLLQIVLLITRYPEKNRFRDPLCQFRYGSLKRLLCRDGSVPLVGSLKLSNRSPAMRSTGGSGCPPDGPPSAACVFK